MPLSVGREEAIWVGADPALEGNLAVSAGAIGVVLFAHGSGSGRHSPRNRFVAARLHESGLGTLLIDLLSEREEADDRHTGHLRFDIGLLAERLVGATAWLRRDGRTAGRTVGFFGASTEGGAALVAAARLPDVGAIVSRGGGADLAGEALSAVQAPTLLIVGGDDDVVVGLNEAALERLAREAAGGRARRVAPVRGAGEVGGGGPPGGGLVHAPPREG